MSDVYLDFDAMARAANRAVFEMVETVAAKHYVAMRNRCSEYALLNGYEVCTNGVQARCGHPKYAVTSPNPYDLYVDTQAPYAPIYMYAPDSRGNFDWQKLQHPAENPSPNWQF